MPASRTAYLGVIGGSAAKLENSCGIEIILSATPRVLRLTYELQVPVGLAKNIYGDRVQRAEESITAAVRSLAPEVFPWADKLRVRSEWSYVWMDNESRGPIALPPTDMNTPAGRGGA